ncbi:(2,3-dihydroxybenzoyl)adenylate synthase [Vibrio lentus]|uniref:(2,3-dihydroxybenzoyl)adenylate synthase n=1 Tax=Vibrio lentus TaxID=136468 RepID=UPI00178CB019|nr:AMP-binding protein [Vibrio lentus]MDN3632959.1 AMP-binding protein [Vibrio lentus]
MNIENGGETLQWPLPGRQKAYFEAGYLFPKTLGDWLTTWSEQFENRTAIVDKTERYTFSQLDEQATQLAFGFLNAGLKPGDKVIVQLPNCICFVTALFAMFRIGVIPVLAMPTQRENDIAALCEQSNPSAYLVPEKFLGFNYVAMAEKIKSAFPSIKTLFVDGVSEKHPALSVLNCSPTALPNINPFELAFLLLSGGTTGTPKLIPRTHSDYAFNFIESSKVCEFSSSTVYLAALPAAHNFPLGCPGIFGTLHVGGKVVMSRTPGSDEAFTLIEQEKVTTTALVPPLLKLWLSSREWDNTDLDTLSLVQVGGAKLDVETAKRVAPELGSELQQVFGMAEGLLCYTRRSDPLDTVLKTQGRPLSCADEIKLVDDDGLLVADGQAGELLTRGPYTIRGYFNADSHNAIAFTHDGFYKSGDIVMKTPEGNYVVEGRVKEQINRAGEKIAVSEIEPLLNLFEPIKESVIVAIPDDQLGERSCVFITSANNEVLPTLNDLRTYLRGLGVPRYKQPDQLEITTHWPLTSVGKIDKKALVAIAQSNMLKSQKS